MESFDFDKTFKFILHQDDVVLYEKIFDANMISPTTRNYVDVRGELSEVIKKIQKLLSKNKYNTIDYFGKNKKIDFYGEHKKILYSYPLKQQQSLIYSPVRHKKILDGKELNGVSCKIGLYINDNLIVERFFYVDNFHPVSRWSVDLVEEMNEIVEEIKSKIIKKDVSNIWDDYEIINKAGMTIIQVRELSEKDRKFWLRRK